ncbi:MAG: NF038122 family metalloprotease [Xenococcaceae cyanobacterium]
MKINFFYSPDISLEQMIGYEMAAVIWGKLFTDNSDVNIMAQSSNTLDANVIGGAVPEFHEQHYALFLQYFEADITSAEDQQAYDALQQGNTVDFLLNGDLVGGNTKIKLTTALAKALGMDEAILLDRYVLDQSDNPLDGTIMMNQSFAWDFDYTREGQTAENTLDFLSVALHETGHILGFTSSLDYSLQQDTLYSGRTELSNFSPLDLFRFSAESLAQNNPDGSVSDLSIGGVAWFSPNGGETLTAKMSTGKEGDGYQASHWERRYDPLGIMDPTLWYQERASITDLDVLAFDIMGYDLSQNAGDVEQLFTTEGLALSLAEAKVNLANKLGVTVQWIEDNANVAVSSPDLIAQVEAAIAEAEVAPESSTTTETASESSTTDTTTETAPEENQGNSFLEGLSNLIQNLYQNWSNNSDNNQNNDHNNDQEESSSSQEFYEWWSQNNGSQNSSWQELYEWWAQNNGSQNSSWQELYEWWVQNNGSQNFSWQELYEWWAQDNGSQNSWWQQVFFASADETTNLDAIELPGEQTNTVDAIYKNITGGIDDDIIAGDISNDNIVAGAGDDLIDGAEGDDTISGGSGFDTIFGFYGNDSIKGGDGDDVISGESDNDVLLGEAGSDVLMGGDHDDYLDGGADNDFLNGNTGHDVLVGRSGKDALEGEAGKDLLIGGEGQDIGNGGSGDDFIFGDEYSASLQQAFGNNVNSLVNIFTPDSEITTTETTTTETTNVQLGLDPVKVEAENMTLSGNYSLASNGTLVRTNSNTARLSTIFNGEAGKYNIVIGYHDVYGNARINASLGTNTIDNWYLNQSSGTTTPSGSNFKTRTIASEVSLNGGESLVLDTTTYVSYSGDDDDSSGIVYDKAYIDYVEFVPIVDNTNNVVLDPDPNTTTDTTTDTTDTTTDTTNTTTDTTNTTEVTLGTNGDLLRGGKGNDGIDGGEGDDVIFGEDELNDSSNIAPLNIDGSFTYGQSTYILTPKAMTWKDAQAYAESRGGNLVTINDAAENQWLKDTFGTTEALFIGMSDAETEGTWKWASGQSVTYTDWAPNEPNDYQGNQDYAILSHIWNDNTDKWDDVTNGSSFRGIIEIDWSSVGGNDTVIGGAGNDQIYGNSGNDQIYGDNTANFTTTAIVKTPKNLTFQQGVNGYNGTVDTILKENYSNNSYSSATSLQVDIDSTTDFQSLIRFDDIFGDELGKIALYDTIDSAILEIDVSNSGNSIAVHQMLQSWSNSATWNSLVNGISANGIEATSTAIATTGSVSTGILSIDVTESLKAWQANPNSNHGWAFLPTGTADVFFDSAEGSNAPRLTVNLNQTSSQSLTVVDVNQTSSQTLTFEQGVNGYNGTIDTKLHGYYSTTNYGNATSLNVDGNDLGYPVQSLIKFDNIFGSQAGQIAQGATINSAILEIDVSDPGNGLKVHELLKNWSESSTYYSWGNGVSANGVEAASTAVATTNWVNTGILQIDVTESLKAWQADPTSNFGWALMATGSDGVDFGSSEGGNAPRLVVDVTNVVQETPSVPAEGHDNITGNGGNDTISGGAGDDILNGTDEMVAGYYEIDVLVGGDGADKFILGDANRAYYATAGYQDYAVIKDFDSSSLDKIQLYGAATDYQSQLQGTDMFLSRNGDLVAILENTKIVNLTGSGFEYVSAI